MNDAQIFERLAKVFGDHTRAASEMGLHPRSYRAIRARGCMTNKQRKLAMLLIGTTMAQGETFSGHVFEGGKWVWMTFDGHKDGG